MAKQSSPPVAPKHSHELVCHGHVRHDPYYWFNDRDSRETIDYLEAENAYTEAAMADTSELRHELYEEMVARLKQDDSSVPYRMDNFWYYYRYEEGGEYPIYCRRHGSMDAAEQIILDVNQIAEDYDYCQVKGLAISAHEDILAFALDTVGRRKYRLCFVDLTTGRQLADEILNTSGQVAWANDNKTLFYTINEEQTLREYKVFRHELGQSPDKDVLVYHEEDDTFCVSAHRTKSKAYIMISSYSTLTSEHRFVDANSPQQDPQVIQERIRELEYHVDHYRDHFYIVTNHEAKNYRVMRAPVVSPGLEHWDEIIPHQDDVLIEELEIFADYLVIGERRDGLTAIRITSWDEETDYQLPCHEPVYTLDLGINPNFESDVLRIEYTSLTTPTSFFDIDLKSGEWTLLKETPVLGGFDKQNYVSERLFAVAEDGTRVPISVVCRKDFQNQKPRPLLLEGYGSYGISNDPVFSSSRLSLLDRGFSFAIAHIRGGQEYGRFWYEDGKLLKKMNTFTDFAACAKHLIDTGITVPELLFAEGRSAGGLLMGAVLNRYPQLFKGILAGVPFVDVVTTMLDDSIPLTTGEYDEWGNPNDEEYYHYMLSYSPYDNVSAQAYPNILVTSGLHDSQVQYWEPTKWVARLRARKTDANLVLLKTDMGAGHSGKTGRYKPYEDIAFEFAFLLKLVADSGRTAVG